MQTHAQLVEKLLRRLGVRVEVERIEREAGVLLDALLQARQDAGLKKVQVAERMGTPPRQWRVWNAHWQLESIAHRLQRCEGISRHAAHGLSFASRDET